MHKGKMMLKEYDITTRNIHHNPLLKQAVNTPEPRIAPEFIVTDVPTGPKKDVFGNTTIHNGERTSFEYAKDLPEIEDNWFEVTATQITTFEDMMQESIHDAVKSTFQSRFKGSKNEFDAVWNKYMNAIRAGSIENPQSIRDIDKFLVGMKKYATVEEQSMDRDKIIESALEMGLTFEETVEIVGIFENDEKPKKKRNKKDTSERTEGQDRKSYSDDQDRDSYKTELGNKNWTQKTIDKRGKKRTEGLFSAKAKTYPFGNGLEAYPTDAPKKMTWNKANEYCMSLGDGWRLPTKEELNQMYENLHRKGLGGFGDSWFWSSSKYGIGYAWSQDFSNGKQVYYYGNSSQYSVRAVRYSNTSTESHKPTKMSR